MIDENDKYYNPNGSACATRNCVCSTAPVIKVYRNEKCPEPKKCPEPEKCATKSQLCAGMVDVRECDFAHEAASICSKKLHTYIVIGLSLLIFIVLIFAIYKSMETPRSQPLLLKVVDAPGDSGIKLNVAMAREAQKEMPGLVSLNGKTATYYPPLIPTK